MYKRQGEAGSPDEVYSIGVKVPELPWLVVQEVPEAAALKPFLAQRNAIVIWAVIAVVVVLLALLAVWWLSLIHISLAEVYVPEPMYTGYDAVIEVADKNNPKLKAYMSDIKAARGEKELAESAYHPKINFEVGPSYSDRLSLIHISLPGDFKPAAHAGDAGFDSVLFQVAAQ